MGKQIERRDDGLIRKLVVRHPEHTPCNKRHGEVKAHAMLKATAHAEAGWLSVHMDEYVDHGGTYRTKRVWMTLDIEEACALRDFLNNNLPPKG